MGKPESPVDAVDTVVRLVDFVFNFVVAVICGVYGNRWYLSHTRAAVSELSREGLPEDAVLEMLSKRGGTNLAASIGMNVMFIVVQLLVLYGAAL